MPTRFRINDVPLKAKKVYDEHNSWSAHVPEGCGREVIRFLELIAANDPDGWVHIKIKALTSKCNGKYRKDGKKGYSEAAVKQWLGFFRAKGIISSEYGRTPDSEERGIKERKGFVVTPHDQGCRKYPKSCNFIGTTTGATYIRRGDAATWVADVTHDEGCDFGLVVEGTCQVPAGYPEGNATVPVGDLPGNDRVPAGYTVSATEAHENNSVNESAAIPNLLSLENPSKPTNPRTPTTTTTSLEQEPEPEPRGGCGGGDVFLKEDITPKPSPIADSTLAAEHDTRSIVENRFTSAILPWWVHASWEAAHGTKPNIASKHIKAFHQLLTGEDDTYIGGDFEVELENSWYQFARLETPPYCLDPDSNDYTRYPVRIFLDDPRGWYDKERFKERLKCYLRPAHTSLFDWRETDFNKRWGRWVYRTLGKPDPNLP